ncbi:atypical dual specificity phosphatase [Phycisphaerales bacterium]|nr:atypical dual specificity phosphatase [Phycisphaerales bacterium]
MTTRALLFLVLAGTIAACASTPSPKPATAARLEPAQCGSISRLHSYNGILLASQPSAADFDFARKDGVKAVLNFRLDSELKDFEEAKVVEGLGMKYISIPWHGEEQLTDAVFDKGRQALSTAPRPLLVHCASANRVGAIWFAWRAIDGGVPVEQALDEAKTIGMKTPGFETRGRAYIAKHTK